MLAVAVKAGFKFSVILVAVGLLQTQSVAEPLLQFATVGLIPGTDIVLSPNTTLYLAAVVLAAIVGWLVYEHRVFHSALEACLGEQRAKQRSESKSLMPGLASLITIASLPAATKPRDVPLIIYFWLRSFGQAVTEQALLHVSPNYKSHYTGLRSSLASRIQKAKMYFVRLSTS